MQLCNGRIAHEGTLVHSQPLPNALFMSAPFWRFVDQSGGPDACWPYVGPGGRDTAGYGQGYFGWTRKAHREAYRLVHPDFDRSLEVCHTCDNPPCCNPAGLFAATHQENLQDAGRKGRLGKRGLDWDQVRAIRAAWAQGTGQGPLARTYGVSQALISNIVNGKRWIEPDEGNVQRPESAEAAA
jgi:hypothetical protein